jgi:2-oxoglutarate ferredoxin oxidoreductase subunit beta
MAQLIVEAIRHPGFSLMQVLSPCITFRPEQMDWKKIVRTPTVDVTNDAARAARRVMTDDGFNVGKVLYQGNRPVFAPERGPDRGLASIEASFAL